MVNLYLHIVFFLSMLLYSYHQEDYFYIIIDHFYYLYCDYCLMDPIFLNDIL